MSKFTLQPFTKSILQLALIALIGYALFLIKGLLVFGVISLYISILGRPVSTLLQRIPKIGARLSNGVRAALTLAVVFGLLGGLLAWFIPVLISEFSFISTIEYDSLLVELQKEWTQLEALLTSLGIDSKTELTELNNSLQNFASVEAISGVLSNIAGSLSTVLIGSFSVLFITFFLIKEEGLAHRFIDSITPKKHHDKVDVIAPQIKTIVTRYSFGILFQISAVFLLLAIGMSVVGVEGAIVLALCAAVFNLIPYVGPLIGAALGILLGMGQLYATSIADPTLSINLVQSFYALGAIFLVVQLLDNVVFQPLIFSNSVGAHPLEIFLIISIAGTLLGVGGMIIAVPMYSICRVIFNTVVNTLQNE